jgi:hypothetical protein
MERGDGVETNRLGTVWVSMRNFYKAWRALREQRYRYLEEILDESAPPPAPTRGTCNHRL